MKPLSESDPIERIRRLSPSMAPSLQRVAVAVARDPAGTAYLSGPGLAARASVSQPTVVRFAQALGYSGYPDFLRGLRAWILTRTTVERLGTATARDGQAIARQVMEADMANIAQTIADLDVDQFERAVRLIGRARRRYVWGIRTTSSVAAYLHTSLSYLYETENVIELAPTLYHEQLLTAGPDDVAVFVSFPRYASMTVEAARQARRRRVPVVAITDSAVSPVATDAECVLFAHSELMSFTESFAAPISLAQALVTALAVSERTASVKRLRSLEKLWTDRAVYHSTDSASVAQRLPRGDR